MTVAASLFRFEDSYARGAQPFRAMDGGLGTRPELRVLNEELAVELGVDPAALRAPSGVALLMAPGGGGVEGDEVEFVRGAWVKVELDGYAGLAEAQGVGEVFVAEHVELGDLDVGGRTLGRVGDAGQAA